MLEPFRSYILNVCVHGLSIKLQIQAMPECLLTACSSLRPPLPFLSSSPTHLFFHPVQLSYSLETCKNSAHLRALPGAYPRTVGYLYSKRTDEELRRLVVETRTPLRSPVHHGGIVLLCGDAPDYCLEKTELPVSSGQEHNATSSTQWFRCDSKLTPQNV